MAEAKRVGILWRGEPGSSARLEGSRYEKVGRALESRGLAVEGVVFSEETAEETATQLRQFDGVLVWVNPVSQGRDRTVLDAVLRDAAADGVWVSAHPDVILKMGTKDVLVRTRDMEWGSECRLYRDHAELARDLPGRLRDDPRVLKQYRGNGGEGVWKVELRATGGPDSRFEVIEARVSSSVEALSMDGLLEKFRPYFEGGGSLIEQPYQERLRDGMIRCYVVRDRVAGFGHQHVTALLPLGPGETENPAPPPRLYFGPEKAEFQGIKERLEGGWIAEMQDVLGIETESLPALWDADFFYGPRTASGEDTYVLCEINISSVFPFPDEALGPLREAVVSRLGE